MIGPDRSQQFAHELAFWRDALAGRGRGLRERLEQMLSRDGRLGRFPVCLLPYIREFTASAGRVPRILDVGSGPMSTLAWAAERGLADVVAVDPLASEYREMMIERGFSYPIQAITGFGEELSHQFALESFDIVYSRNALDHCESPHRVMAEVVEVLADDGVLFLEGLVAEGTHQRWTGLHQHDILPRSDGLYHRGRQGRVSSLTAGLPLTRVFAGRGRGEAEPAESWNQSDWFVFAYRKLDRSQYPHEADAQASGSV